TRSPLGSCPGSIKARGEGGMTSRTGAGSVVPCVMARILLGVGVPIITLCYPQAWLFEPFFPLRWIAGAVMWLAITPSPAGCQARRGGMLGLVGKNCSLSTISRLLVPPSVLQRSLRDRCSHISGL